MGVHGGSSGGTQSKSSAQCARSARIPPKHRVGVELLFWGGLKRSATIWASGRTRDPYFEILGAPRGIMVTPSVRFDF